MPSHIYALICILFLCQPAQVVSRNEKRLAKAKEMEAQVDDLCKNVEAWLKERLSLVDKPAYQSTKWLLSAVLMTVIVIWWITLITIRRPTNAHPLWWLNDYGRDKFFDNMKNVSFVAFLFAMNLGNLRGAQYNGTPMMMFGLFLGFFVVGLPLLFLVEIFLRQVIEVSDTLSLTANNTYINFAVPGTEVLLKFVGQSTLFLMYMYSTCKVDVMDEAFTYSFFLAALVASQIYMLSANPNGQMGSHYFAHVHEWHTLLNINLDSVKITVDGKPLHHLKPCRIRLQWIAAAIVNFSMYFFILFTVPILLASSDTPLDFVKDCFAVAFITTLDDCNDVTLKIEALDVSSEDEDGICGICCDYRAYPDEDHELLVEHDESESN